MSCAYFWYSTIIRIRHTDEAAQAQEVSNDGAADTEAAEFGNIGREMENESQFPAGIISFSH